MQGVMNSWTGSRKDCYPLLQDHWTYKEEIIVENDLLFKSRDLFIPEMLCNKTLQTIHEGHSSIEKIQLKAKETVFWAKITAGILQTDWSCKVCQTFSRSQQGETLMPHEILQGPWEKLVVDCFEFQSTNYFLTADYYTNLPIIRRARSTKTNAATDKMNKFFSEYGKPKTVMSGNGTQFTSMEYEAFANQYFFNNITSSPR